MSNRANGTIGRSAPEQSYARTASRKRAAVAVLDRDHPEIGVEALLTLDTGVHVVQRFFGRQQLEKALARLRFVEHRLWRRPVEIGGAAKPIDNDEDRTGFLGAAPDHRGESAFDKAAANIGPDPQGRGDAHGLEPFPAYSAFMAPMLTSRWTILSFSSPVTGRPLSSWKRRMASPVCWLACPSTVSGP